MDKKKLKDTKYTTIISYNGTNRGSDFEVLQKRLIANRIDNNVVTEKSSRSGYTWFEISRRHNVDVFKIYDNPVIKSSHFNG